MYNVTYMAIQEERSVFGRW